MQLYYDSDKDLDEDYELQVPVRATYSVLNRAPWGEPNACIVKRL